MAWLQLANNAQTVLGGVVSLLAGSITPSSKASFPDPDVDGSFYVTLSDPGFANPTDDSTRETVLVTANDGAAWTVTRAQCGTSAQEHAIADRVSLYLMAEHLEEIEAVVDLNTAARHVAVTVADTTSVDLTLTGQQLSAAVLPAGVNHDALAGFVENEHIDWTVSQGGTLIHADNYVGGGGATYTAGDGLALADDEFSLDPAWVDQAVTQAGTPQFARLGLGAAAGTARLTLVEGTTEADGIAFGADVDLFRAAANVLKTNDSLHIGGAGITFPNGNATVAPSSGWIKLEGANKTYINYDNPTVGVQIGKIGNSLALDLYGTFSPTGGIPLPENAAVILDQSLSADGKYCGTVRAGTAGATLAFGDLIYLDPTDGRWELVDANSAAAADGDARGLIGMCVQAAASDGDATTVLYNGVIRADAAFPNLGVGQPVYASESAGDVTTTQPTTSGVVIRVVGFSINNNEMLFAPSSDYITHA
jgi:hypothetical protein